MSTLALVVTASVLSAALTALLVALAFQRLVVPRLEERLRARLEAEREEFAQAVARSVRKGLLEGVSALPSREVLQDTTRTIARTGMELVGDGLNTLLGGRRPARRTGDREKPDDADSDVT